MERNGDAVLLWILVVVSLALGLYAIDSWPLWYDEAFTAEHVRLFDWELLIRDGTRNPPLHILLSKAWATAFGGSDFSLRAFSAWVGAASIPVVYLLANELFDRSTARIAAVLMTASPLHVYFSQECRTYSLLILVVSAFYWFLLRALARGRIGDWVGFAATGAIGMFLHYFMAFALLASAWPVLAWKRDEETLRRILSYAASLLVIGVVLAPWIAFSFSLRRGVLADPFWIERIGVLQAAKSSLEVLGLGGTKGYHLWKQYMSLDYPRSWRYAGLLCVAGLIASAVVAGAPPRAARETVRRTAIAVGLVVLPCLGLLLASRLYVPMYKVGRYDLIAFVPLVVLIARGGSAALGRSRYVGAAALGFLLSLYGAELYLYYAQPVQLPLSYPGLDFARVLGERTQPGDAVLLYNDGLITRHYAARFGMRWDGDRCGRDGQFTIPCRLLVQSKIGPIFDFETGRRSDRPDTVEPWVDELLSDRRDPVARVWVDDLSLPFLEGSLEAHGFLPRETIHPAAENKRELLLFERSADPSAGVTSPES
jgi:4-amino-4-deoxy-L-arabinose transferase-like glycosyltransferase